MRPFTKTKKRLSFLIWIASLLVSLPLSAQQQTISGSVLDEFGEPVIGANVLVKGTTNGTITDIQGQFRLNASPQSTLLFSFIGYQTQEIPLNGRTSIKVVLREDAIALSEFVAIGYGTVKKSDATGSVTMIEPDAISKGLATSAQDLLVGKSPGVVVTLNGGEPGSPGTIRIRGGSSLNANNDPLIVIDGVPVDNSGITGLSNPLSMIAPDNIETFTVLKDASATAIYGSRASNGVILITTKKGAKGRLQINFNANAYVETPRNKVEVYDAAQFREMIAQQYGTSSNAYALLGAYNTNWQDHILRTSFSQDYNLSVGGSVAQVLPFRFAVTYTGQNGIVKTSSMDRTTASLSLTPKLFDDKLSINANVKGVYVRNRFADLGAVGGAVSFDPTQQIKVPGQTVGNGYFMWFQPGTENLIGISPLNPVSLIDQRDNRSEVYRSVGNLQLDYIMPFLPELRANLNLGYDWSKSRQNNVLATNSPQSYKENNKTGEGQNELLTQFKRNLLLDFYLNYAQELESIQSRFDVMAGYSWQRFHNQGNTNTYLLTTNQRWFTSSYADHLQLISFFGRLNYTYKDTYLLTFTMRGDATSRFSEDNRWGGFPAVALGWKILNEPFAQKLTTFMNDLKLRLGYGITGQQDIVGNYFPYLPLYQLGFPTAQFPIDGNYINTLRPNGYDPNIKWEETETYNVGLDMGFMQGRFTATFDYYYRNTKDLISRIPVPAGSNLTNEIFTNIGSLRNEGVEFSVQAKAISNKEFVWDIGYNIAFNSNKITKLNRSNSTDYYIPVGGIAGGTGNTVQAHKVDYPAYSFYLFEQVYGSNGKPIEGLYVDQNNDGIIDEADKVIRHSKDPKVIMSLSSKMEYKNFDFSFSLRASLGNYIYDNVLSNNSAYSGTYTSAGYLNNLISRGTKFNNPQYMSDYYLRKGDFLRCDNITLGYTWNNVTKEKMKIRLYGAVQNPFVITDYEGLDPEVFSGIDNNVYPRPTTYLMGLIVTY